MSLGHQSRGDFVHWPAVPSLEVDVVVAFVVVLGALCQLSYCLKCGVSISEGRHTFRYATWINTSFHVLEDFPSLLARDLRCHSRIRTNGIADGLAPELRFGEKGLRLSAHTQPKAG